MTPNGFAGSIFDLEPATELRSPLRPVRSRRRQRQDRAHRVTVRTRAEPMPAAGGKVYHVYPPGHKGERQEPAFTGLLAAYYTGSSHSDNFNTYPARVQPGDTILVHAGVYKDDRYRYGGGLGTVSSGTYFLTQSGTAEKPIVIKAAGDGEAIFDGDGAYNLFNVMAANLQLLRGPDDSQHRARLSGRAEEHHRLERPDDQALPLRERRPRDLHRLVGLEGLLHRRQRDDRPVQSQLPDGIHRAHMDEPARVQSEADLRVRGEGLRLRPRRRLQLDRQLPRRRGRRDLRKSGRQLQQPSPRSPAGVDRLLRQRHLQRRGQLHRGRRRRAQHPHLPQPLLQSRPPRAQRAADVRRSGVLHPQRRLPRAGRRRGEVHRVLVGHCRVPQHASSRR